MGGDATIRLAVFNDDGGWATEEKTWNKWSEESVEEFLSETAGFLPMKPAKWRCGHSTAGERAAERQRQGARNESSSRGSSLSSAWRVWQPSRWLRSS